MPCLQKPAAVPPPINYTIIQVYELNLKKSSKICEFRAAQTDFVDSLNFSRPKVCKAPIFVEYS